VRLSLLHRILHKKLIDKAWHTICIFITWASARAYRLHMRLLREVLPVHVPNASILLLAILDSGAPFQYWVCRSHSMLCQVWCYPQYARYRSRIYYCCQLPRDLAIGSFLHWLYRKCMKQLSPRCWSAYCKCSARKQDIYSGNTSAWRIDWRSCRDKLSRDVTRSILAHCIEIHDRDMRASLGAASYVINLLIGTAVISISVQRLPL
jgi:hypothetical protein